MMKPIYYLAAISCLIALTTAPAVAQTAAPAKSPAPAAAPAKTTPPAPAGLVDINSAPVEELDKLPGVGPARAQAIISHRPYGAKDELTQRKVIPQNVYNQIKDKIVARQGAMPPAVGPAKSPAAPPKAK